MPRPADSLGKIWEGSGRGPDFAGLASLTTLAVHRINFAGRQTTGKLLPLVGRLPAVKKAAAPWADAFIKKKAWLDQAKSMRRSPLTVFGQRRGAASEPRSRTRLFGRVPRRAAERGGSCGRTREGAAGKQAREREPEGQTLADEERGGQRLPRSQGRTASGRPRRDRETRSGSRDVRALTVFGQRAHARVTLYGTRGAAATQGCGGAAADKTQGCGLSAGGWVGL